MGIILEHILSNFEILLLFFARISGLLFISPIFGRRNIPAIFKIGLALGLSYIMVVYYPFPKYTVEITTYIQLVYYVIKELLIGLIMGYITLLTFSALLLAGQLIDTQIGFGVIHVLDPYTNIQVPLVGNFNNALAMIVFFAIDGHHTLIQLLFHSFDIIPVGKVKMDFNMAIPIVGMFIKSFVLGLKIAIPIMASAFLSEVAFGILVKLSPQMNIFVIGIPFKILIGLIMLFLIVPVYIGILNGTFHVMFENIESIMQGMGIP
jgi:flagellar biosynthetic protein FliR